MACQINRRAAATPGPRRRRPFVMLIGFQLNSPTRAVVRRRVLLASGDFAGFSGIPNFAPLSLPHPPTLSPAVLPEMPLLCAIVPSSSSTNGGEREKVARSRRRAKREPITGCNCSSAIERPRCEAPGFRGRRTTPFDNLSLPPFVLALCLPHGISGTEVTNRQLRRTRISRRRRYVFLRDICHPLIHPPTHTRARTHAHMHGNADASGI